jgi:hypothetical protein
VRVHVESDGPVEFAVVYIGKSACITDAQGICEVRFKRPQSEFVRVAVAEFPTCPYFVLSSPKEVTPTIDGEQVSVRVSRSQLSASTPVGQ